MEPLEYFKSQLKNPDFAKSYGAERAQMELALALVEARNEMGLTQKVMAEKLGLSQPYIAKLEKGTANPTIKQIGSLLAQIGLRPLIKMVSLVKEEPAVSSEETVPAAITLADAAQSYNAVIPIFANYTRASIKAWGYATAVTAVNQPPELNLAANSSVFRIPTPETHVLESTVSIWSREGAVALPA